MRSLTDFSDLNLRLSEEGPSIEGLVSLCQTILARDSSMLVVFDIGLVAALNPFQMEMLNRSRKSSICAVLSARANMKDMSEQMLKI
jgi:uncharacterized protein related to proFAR isomerase